MKKTKLLIATAALSLAAVAAGTVSTMAWYTADQQAKISKGNAVEGTLSTKASTIAASTYSINFTVKVGGAASKQLELALQYVVFPKTQEAYIIIIFFRLKVFQQADY